MSSLEKGYKYSFSFLYCLCCTASDMNSNAIKLHANILNNHSINILELGYDQRVEYLFLSMLMSKIFDSKYN